MADKASQDGALPGEPERLRRELAERDRVIAELRESRDEFIQLIETTSTGYVILDERGTVLDANREYVRLTGRGEPAEILGRSVTEWTAPHDRERNALEVRKCLERGSVRDLVVDYVDPDGRITPVEINASRRVVSGATLILTVCRDATQRRRAEEALAHSVQQYRTTIDSMGEMIHVVDPQLRVLLMNRPGSAWMGALGLTDDPLGRALFEVFPFLPDRVREEYRQVFESGQPLITEEQSFLGPQRFVTETRKIPIVERGAVARVVTVVRDITAAVEAQERLRQAEKMEALGQLAGGIAHDFNNHIGVVLGCAELLLREVGEAALREHAETIHQSAVRSSELTQQLMAFARKAPLGTERVDVHALIADLTVLLRHIVDRRIEIRHRLDAERHVVEGDFGQLQNALLNLAINARDAMPDGGRLLFSTELVPSREAGRAAPAAAGMLRIRVTDTGTGMGEETLKRLFEPFFTTKPPGKGTGMGLASAYGTVARHQGTIQVSSAPGRGSVFTIELPTVDLE